MTGLERAGHPEGFPWDGAFVVPDVQRQEWWPYRPVEGVVDSLWLLGEEAEPSGLFGQLVEKWGCAQHWLAAGTTLFGEGRPPPSWGEQHAEWALERVGRLVLDPFDVERPFGRCTEWWTLKPSADQLLSLLQGPLQHPNQGWWLAVASDPDGGARFVRATAGLLWWSLRDYKPYQSRVHEVVDESIVEALLGLLPQIGFVSVVPLNSHPVGGVVLLGTPEALAEAAASLGGLPMSRGEEVQAIWARGGWLATG